MTLKLVVKIVVGFANDSVAEVASSSVLEPDATVVLDGYQLSQNLQVEQQAAVELMVADSMVVLD